jgi:hypothetical protein
MSEGACSMAFMTEALDRSAILLPTHVVDDLLGRVPGACVVRASRLLPDPACALDDEMSVDDIADRIGPVRLTLKKRRYCRPNGKISYVSWLCRHAEPVASAESSNLNETKGRKFRLE